jgi:hypothetical protein
VQEELSAIRRRSPNNDSTSTADANPTGGDRSKVHPADKYSIEELAPPVVDLSRSLSTLDPEVDNVAVEEL